MDVEHVPHRGTPPTPSEIEARLRAEASGVHSWSNGPGDRYGEHEHPYRKVLYCVRGSIDFVLAEGRRVSLKAGARLVIPPGTRHGAVVGPDGCTCMEGQS
jgi:quercetin dioxygenase-like cupin family protein